VYRCHFVQGLTLEETAFTQWQQFPDLSQNQVVESQQRVYRS
jgi:hypothetical protein